MTALVRAGYKQTEVGVIPTDWLVKTVESVLSEISMGPFGSDIKVSNFVSSGVPVLSGVNVRCERLHDSFTNFVTPAKAKALKKAVAQRGDIVVTHRGTLGQISFIPDDSEFDKYVISQSQFRARFNASAVIPSWVTLYFLSPHGSAKLLEGKGHTGVPALAQATTKFRQLCIPLPPLPEQRAIATALSDVDVLLAKLDALIAKKRDLKVAAMQQLLTGQTRLPGFGDGNGSYMNTEVGAIPADWRVTTVGQIADVGRGRVISHREIAKAVSPTYPVYSSQTSNDGVMGYLDTFEFDGEYVTWTTDGANAGTVFYRNGRFNCTNVCGTIKVRSDDAYFVSKALAVVAPKYVSRNLGNPKLMNDVAKKIVFSLPGEIAEQTAIATVLSDMDNELTALEARRDKTRAIKQGMMQELLTGRIRLV